MRLQHLHLLRPVPYPLASRVQDAVVRQHIDDGLLRQRAALSDPSPSPIPPSASIVPRSSSPFLLTFQTTPTYTCGRREIPLIGEDRIAYLQANGRAAFHHALRGGQTTFHGPGQLTAYLVLSLRTHGLSPRCYVRFLENAVIELCGAYGIGAKTTADPGVWVDDVTKICAVGVHMRRGVTSHGIGLNVHTDPAWFERIVACGLEGKKVTSLEAQGVRGCGVREVAMVFADIVARGLKGVEGIDGVDLAGSAEKPGDYSPPPPGE